MQAHTTAQITQMTRPSAGAASHRRRAVLFARLTLVGVALYVVLDVIAQLLPPHYNPITQAESDLGVGPYGWLMAINFIVRGLLSLSAVLALWYGLPAQARLRVGELLLAIWGVGAFILAFARTDLPGQHPTLHGVIHLLVAAVAFLVAAIGEVLLSTRLGVDPHMRTIASVATVIALLAIGALVALVALSGPTHLGGLIERIFIGLILLWLVIVAARLQAHPTRSSSVAGQ